MLKCVLGNVLTLKVLNLLSWTHAFKKWWKGRPLGWQQSKLMRLGLTNQIVDNSDFKQVDFDRQFLSNLKSNDKSESTISILIWIRSILIKRSLKRSIRLIIWSKKSINGSKKLIKSRFRSNSTNFQYKSKYFWYKWSGFKSNCRDE